MGTTEGRDQVRRHLELGQTTPYRELLKALQESVEATYGFASFGFPELAKSELEKAKIILTDLEKHANAIFEKGTS